MVQNYFSPPTGPDAGTDYVKEYTWLLRAYKDKTPLERITLWAIVVILGLLLQKPHAHKAKSSFHHTCL